MRTSLPVFVGLDYHQDAVQVCVLDARGRQLLNRPVANDWRAIARSVEPLGRVKRVGIESCGGAADLAEELVERAGWSVALAHPGYVARMKQSPDKSDYGDGRMLADLVRVGYLPRVWLAPEPVRELRRLVRHRQSLVNERRAAKQRIGAVLREQRLRCPPPGRGTAARWSKPWLAWLTTSAELSPAGRWVVDHLLAHLRHLGEAIAQVERELDRATRTDATVARLKALPGIGDVTAWVLRANIGRFDRFRTGKQLSRFCGLSPRNTSSGPRQADAGLIKAGDALLRATLIEAAHRLQRSEPRWRELAGKLRATGKPPCLIAAAVANRYVRWLFHRMTETGAATATAAAAAAAAAATEVTTDKVEQGRTGRR